MYMRTPGAFRTHIYIQETREYLPWVPATPKLTPRPVTDLFPQVLGAASFITHKFSHGYTCRESQVTCTHDQPYCKWHKQCKEVNGWAYDDKEQKWSWFVSLQLHWCVLWSHASKVGWGGPFANRTPLKWHKWDQYDDLNPNSVLTIIQFVVVTHIMI